MKDIRIAAVIFSSPVGKIKQNLDRMAKNVKEAKKKGAVIICFPEMNLTGYTTGEDVKDTAETVPGPITQDLSRLAVGENIVILAGVTEKNEKGRIFASHLVVKPDGTVDTYRKLHTAPPEQKVYSPGNRIPLFETQGVKFGIQLCYDTHFPELSTQMALEGADLIFMPHASPRGTPEEKYRSWMRHLPARAYDNSVFIIACNQAGENEEGLSFPGIAVIIGPSGNIIDKDLSGKEGIIVADLKSDDLSRIRNNRMHFFLPNRRPELYTRQTVTF